MMFTLPDSTPTTDRRGPLSWGTSVVDDSTIEWGVIWVVQEPEGPSIALEETFKYVFKRYDDVLRRLAE